MTAVAVDRVPAYALRAAFARGLAAMYGREVPAYETLVEVTREVNAEVVATRGEAAERLGSVERVIRPDGLRRGHVIDCTSGCGNSPKPGSTGLRLLRRWLQARAAEPSRARRPRSNPAAG